MIYIDVQMPKNCYDCWIRQNMGCRIANDSGWLNDRRDDKCPLKTQEPRVMTLDEVRESIEHDKRISVYLQQKNGICREPRPALYTNLYGEGIDLRLGVDYVDYGGWLEQIVLYTKEYLKTWCLWTSRPTDEQREAMKWKSVK